MRILISILLPTLITVSALAIEKPVTQNIDWEQACEGSNIAVTKVAGEIVSIDAYAQHFAEGRQWNCHYHQGKIVSALYRHFKVNRQGVVESDELKTELVDDHIQTFHFPDHELQGLPPELEKDLRDVIARATGSQAPKQ